jgi:hypothetical protein
MLNQWLTSEKIQTSSEYPDPIGSRTADSTTSQSALNTTVNLATLFEERVTDAKDLPQLTSPHLAIIHKGAPTLAQLFADDDVPLKVAATPPIIVNTIRVSETSEKRPSVDIPPGSRSRKSPRVSNESRSSRITTKLNDTQEANLATAREFIPTLPLYALAKATGSQELALTRDDKLKRRAEEALADLACTWKSNAVRDGISNWRRLQQWGRENNCGADDHFSALDVLAFKKAVQASAVAKAALVL